MKSESRLLVWSRGANHCVLLPPTHRCLSRERVPAQPGPNLLMRPQTFGSRQREQPHCAAEEDGGSSKGRGSVLSKRWHSIKARSQEGGRRVMLGNTHQAVPHLRVSFRLGSFCQRQCAFQHPAPDTRGCPQRSRDGKAPASHRTPEPSYYFLGGDP